VSPISSSTPLPQEITDLITSKAQRLVGHYRFTESDREEIEQQIALQVVRKRATVPEPRAQQMGFLITLVQHAVADIVAARKASNRDYRREDASLDQWVQDAAGGWELRGEMITEDDAARHVGRPGASRGDGHDLAIDLADAANRLSPRLREVFEQYAVLGSPREVAKAIGVHHSTVYEALKQIKDHFEQAGLTIYLSKPRANPTVSGTRR
jgi:RNA polymerase sigma-70 factor (ECF subfamily)